MNTEIVDLIAAYLRVSKEDANIWYRNITINAFGCKTARQMVTLGKGEAVRKYIEHLRNGGYA